MKINIEWTEDGHDCETCGSSSADGAIVKIDGAEVFNFAPLAACYDGESFTEDFVLGEILTHLGCNPHIKHDCDEYRNQLKDMGHELEETHTYYEWPNYDDEE